MWEICVSEDEKFMNVEKIFPTQQRDVSTIVNALSKIGIVEKVIIFGSTLN